MNRALDLDFWLVYIPKTKFLSSKIFGLSRLIRYQDFYKGQLGIIVTNQLQFPVPTTLGNSFWMPLSKAFFNTKPCSLKKCPNSQSSLYANAIQSPGKPTCHRNYKPGYVDPPILAKSVHLPLNPLWRPPRPYPPLGCNQTMSLFSLKLPSNVLVSFPPWQARSSYIPQKISRFDGFDLFKKF